MHPSTSVSWCLVCVIALPLAASAQFEPFKTCSNEAVQSLQKGDLSTAEQATRRALAEAERAFWTNDVRIDMCLVLLRVLCMDAGKYSEAEELGRRMLKRAEKQYGVSHAETAAAMSMLADTLVEQEKFSEAEQLLRSSISIKEKAFGRNSEFLAPAEMNLATVLREQGKLDEAERTYKSAAAKVEKEKAFVGVVATILENLATVYERQSKFADAETVLERALDIRKNQYGLNHVFTAQDQSRLAALRMILGRTEEAERQFQSALATMESTIGPDHIAVGMVLVNYARALLHAKVRLDRAEAFLRRSITIIEKAMGPNHPKLAGVLNLYAALLRETGREDEASDAEKRAKAIREARR